MMTSASVVSGIYFSVAMLDLWERAMDWWYGGRDKRRLLSSTTPPTVPSSNTATIATARASTTRIKPKRVVHLPDPYTTLLAQHGQVDASFPATLNKKEEKSDEQCPCKSNRTKGNKSRNKKSERWV
jgi:hypothetical protein